MSAAKPKSCWFFRLELSATNTSNMGGRSCQTIVKKIRVPVSNREVNRLPAVKVANKEPAADKDNNPDSRVANRRVRARAVKKVVVKKVVSRATADSIAVMR